MYKLGLIGVGHMGGALLNGAINCGVLTKKDIIVFDVSKEKLALLEKDGYNVATSLAEVRRCEFLLLAVAPQVFKGLLNDLKAIEIKHRQVIISVAAGITAELIKQHLAEVGVVCVMPNAPALIGMGASALAKTPDVTQREFEIVREIFEGVGMVAELSLDQLFSVVPANGSAPAYVYYLIDCVAKAVAARGIDYDTALKLTAQTFKGSAELLMQSDKSPTELVAGVCTPGGLTEQSILSFERDDLATVIKRGCDACIDRGLEIRKQEAK